MKKLLIIVICLITILLFTGCKGSKSIAARGYSPTELTAEQLQKFAVLMGVDWNDIIFIDKSTGVVFISGNMDNIDNLRFVLQATILHVQRQDMFEALTKQATSDRKNIVVYVIEE